MAIRDDDFGAAPALTEGDDEIWSPSGSALPCEARDLRSLYEQEHARAERERARAGAAEARVQELLNDIRRLRTALRKAGAGKGRSEPQPRDALRQHRALERSRNQNNTIEPLRMEIAELRKEATAQRKAARAAETLLSRESARLCKTLERSQEQKDTIESLRREARSLNHEIRQLHRKLEGAETHKATIRRQYDDIIQLHGKLSGLRNEKRTILSLYDRAERLERALATSELDRMLLQNQLARRRANKEALPQLRKALRRSRRQKTTIKSLRKENARLRKAVRASQTRSERLEAQLARLLATRAVLSKALFGSKTERQERPRSERKRGQQPGAPGHGRTQRPALEEKTEQHDPPKDARVCSCCGKPYVANGARVSSIVEIEVRAHTRRIVRPRWRRGCDCASSPLEVTAPPVPRLFDMTPYGTSVWARVLFERHACFRPLNRVAVWLADQGLAISPGTLANSVRRFVPLFEPLAEAILAHQNEAAVRHGDETGWRIQSLSETGRSRRAWLWISVSADAVYFLIDPSRSAEVAKTLFGATVCIVFLVCDRHGAYKKLARELGGKVILCWCWAHQRRSFIQCAAGQARLTEWCRGWIERIASIYRLNEARLAHYDPNLEDQGAAFEAAQRELKEALDDLFAEAERELANLPARAREGKALRSLLNHREGLSVFVDRAQVPPDNNAAERGLRGAVIGRRLSFGSDSENGARFTAMMYSVVGTLASNGIDVLSWLEAWLAACAENGGQPPDDLSPWLPWSMSGERKRSFTAPE